MSRTVSTSLKIPELVDCNNCSGQGFFKGMFYEMVCDACDGNGSVDAKTGEVVSKELMVFALRKENAKLQSLLGHLKNLCTCKAKEQGHWDKFKSAFGGKKRFD